MIKITENDNITIIREKIISLIEGHCGTMLSVEYHKITTEDLIRIAMGMKVLTPSEATIAAIKS